MPAVNPDDALRAAKGIADLYAEATARLLESVASRLALGVADPSLSMDSWSLQKLAELAGLRAEAEREVARLTGAVQTAVPEAITELHTIGARAAQQDLGLKATWTPRTNKRAVDALARAQLGQLDTMNAGILRRVEDVYRGVIGEVSAPGVVLGVDTRLQATQRALDAFARQGISGFRDGKGRNWEIESYAEMSTRTAAQRAAIAGREAVYTEEGVELVIVSDSVGECALCRPFERKLLALGSTGMVDETVGGILVVDTLEGARQRGFQHPNCRHDIRPYVAGLTRPAPGPTADPEGEAQRNRQRALERSKREALRMRAVAIDPEARAKADAVIAKRNAQLRETVTPGKRQRAREQVKRAR